MALTSGLKTKNAVTKKHIYQQVKPQGEPLH